MTTTFAVTVIVRSISAEPVPTERSSRRLSESSGFWSTLLTCQKYLATGSFLYGASKWICNWLHPQAADKGTAAPEQIQPAPQKPLPEAQTTQNASATSEKPQTDPAVPKASPADQQSGASLPVRITPETERQIEQLIRKHVKAQPTTSWFNGTSMFWIVVILALAYWL